MHRAGIIVPLYQYPLSDATWKPLHEAILAYPSLQFLIIINPNSGPGDSPLPDTKYAAELPRLTGQSNVTCVGYVRIDYCRRALQAACRDVATYAGWSTQINATPGAHVNGVFVDETPNHDDDNASKAAYLLQLTTFARSRTGFVGQPLIVYNPGTEPDAGLRKAGTPDWTVVLEESYSRYASSPSPRYLDDGADDQTTPLPNTEKQASCLILHSVPPKLVPTLARHLRSKYAFIFLTELSVRNCYNRFGETWAAFVAAMEEGGDASVHRQAASTSSSATVENASM